MKRYQLATPSQKKQFQILPLPLWLYRCKKFKVLIDSFQRYWWSKNTAIWLVESVLGRNWKTRFLQNMQFLQIIKNTILHHI